MSESWFFDVLPLRPDPFPGECLSGYLLRLADLNGYGILWDMIGDLFPTWDAPEKIHKLKWEYPLKEWGRIPLRTGLKPDELVQLTMLPWVGKFRVLPKLDSSIYMSPGHFLKNLVNPVLRVCPLCLQSQPYLRLIWRLLPVTACLEHGCLLQENCSTCGAILTPVSQDHRHLRCPACGTDLRSLSTIMASQDTLNVQRRRQEDYRFLLDPATAIAQTGADAEHNPSRAIGLKFRYIRYRAGISTRAMARKANLTIAAMKSIEQGSQAALPYYLAYLEALQLSWKAFAILDVPDEFAQEIHTPRHKSIRICPNPKCSNYDLLSSTDVFMLRDMPEERFARFRCKVCGKRFTRSYDGSLRTKPRRPALRTGEHHTLMKSQAEIATLIEMGLRGDSNRQIARSLGWGEKTVRIYWIALGMEEQVHQAQAKKRANGQLEKRTRLSSQIQVVLEPLLEKNRRITLRQVHEALGPDCFYLGSCPDLADFVRLTIQQHNIRIKRHVDDAVSIQNTEIIASLWDTDHIVKVEEIARRAGLSYGQLRSNYPDLRLKVHRAIQEHRARLKELHLKNQIRQIDDAANRLSERGVRLTYQTILREAGLNPSAHNSAPIRDALARWVSNFAPRD
jgi:transcriptional regulator with XRE-family HTH domain/DNA-binding CsgD family transcriptional regulator